jgi:putative nucleotidyltransferase with HDIG domain
LLVITEPLPSQIMKKVTVVADSVRKADDLRNRLGSYFEARSTHLDDLAALAPGEFVLVDVDLTEPARLPDLITWLTQRPINGRVIFGVDPRSHYEITQANALGATALLPRPFDTRQVIRLSLPATPTVNSEPIDDICAASISDLEKMFTAVLLGEPIEIQTLNAAATYIVARIEEEGLLRWLEVVRRYHSQTYQHSAIVTAVAISFGRHLGFNKADKNRLAWAGLLHDLGKAQVPIHILEKPTQLTPEEAAVMQTHPQLGYEALRNQEGIDLEMLDMVLHHHEYLDGSGYPHGLGGGEIPDLVRIITIADIYGALVELRPYKQPMSGPDAFQTLVDMGPKLDQDLVRAFRGLAQCVH